MEQIDHNTHRCLLHEGKLGENPEDLTCKYMMFKGKIKNRWRKDDKKKRGTNSKGNLPIIRK